MGNKIFREETPAPASPPPKNEPTLQEIFDLKSQFLECWTVEDVEEWLKFHALEDFINIARHLVLDGDALIQLTSYLSSYNNNNDENTNTNNNNTEENSEPAINNENKMKRNEEPPLPVPPFATEVVQQIEGVNKEKVSKLLGLIKEMVNKYDSQLGQSTRDDEKYAPYEYPKFEKEDPASRNELVMFYHQNTQHTKNGGSRSVDRRWFSQPRIFRRYFGTPYTRLEIPPNLTSPSSSPSSSSPTTPYNALFFQPSLAPQPLNFKTISSFLFYSLSVSGRRDMWTLTSSPRSAWVKRVNPSSGGLHPIEAYVILPPGVLGGENKENKEKEEEERGGVYHYAVRHHALERRNSISVSEFPNLEGIFGGKGENFVIGISSIHWREVWKYGERGFRYSMLDAGHALGSLAVAAARLGWQITLLPNMATDDVESILGITDANQFTHQVERERGLILAVVSTSGNRFVPSDFSELKGVLNNSKWEGAPNHLSADHLQWDIVSKVDNITKVENIDVDAITRVIEKPKEEKGLLLGEKEEEIRKLSESMSLEYVISSRRSALDYINRPISLDQFIHIMHSISKSNKVLSFPWPATANLFIFAYQVSDLPSGVYVLVRNNEDLEEIKKVTEGHGFAWTTPANVSSLPLYLLKEIPKEELSKTSHKASCSQTIASQGAFSLGMFVNIDKVMKEMGPSGYCRSHFECGALGQLLYLEAHALGLGATGMGCYLDDLAQDTFGLEKSSIWPLYHFAIGVPSVDNRYTPYDYRENMFEGVLGECVSILQK